MKQSLFLAAALFCTTALADPPAAVKVSPTDGPGTSTYGPILYDPSGNIMAIGNNSGVSSSYIYDPMGRLTVAYVQRAGHLQSQSYTYDTYGNRTAVTTPAGTTYATVDGSNRLAAATYDAAGNLTQWTPPGSATPRAYAYDSLNMITRESAGPNHAVTHIYTASDERYWRHTQSAGVEQSDYTLRDLGGKVLRHYRETATAFTIANDYVYRDGLLLAAVTPAGTHHYSLDHLGTPRIVTNQTGHLVAEHTYYPFGVEITDNSPTDGLLKFTGHERDTDLLGETSGQLDYMHARYYSTSLGRFLSVDPGKDWDPRQPQSWNMYAYVRNNPINTIDPTGKWGWSDFKSWVRDTRADISNWWSEKWHKDIPAPADQYGGVEALEAADLSPADAQQMGNPQANWANAQAEAGAILSDQATEEVMTFGVGKVVGVAGVVVFGHGARHLVGTALQKEAVEAAIEKEVQFVSREASQTGSFWGRVKVNGQVIEYRAHTLPDGTINVGTYYTPEP